MHFIRETGKREVVEYCKWDRNVERDRSGESGAVILVQEECGVRPMLGRLREQNEIEEGREGSAVMYSGSDRFFRLLQKWHRSDHT